MIRVSTTTLDSFRRVLTTEYANEAELAANIKGEFIPTWQMQAGSAWDYYLSLSDEAFNALCVMSEHTQIEKDLRRNGYGFCLEDIACGRNIVGPGISQVKATRAVETPYGQVNLVAQVDHTRGLVIQENKAKFSPADARDYESALQWRYYLWIHGAACVRYNLFSFHDPKDGYCELTDLMSFKFWPYANLESDCRMWLLLFLEWADSKHLIPFLDREGSTPNLAA